MQVPAAFLNNYVTTLMYVTDMLQKRRYTGYIVVPLQFLIEGVCHGKE